MLLPVPWLRGLGFRADEARAAAALCENIPDAPLEQRVRVALSYFRPRGARIHRSVAGPDRTSSLAGAASVASAGTAGMAHDYASAG